MIITFEPEYAEEYGLNEAVIMKAFKNYLSQNRKEGKDFYDGRTWKRIFFAAKKDRKNNKKPDRPGSFCKPQVIINEKPN